MSNIFKPKPNNNNNNNRFNFNNNENKFKTVFKNDKIKERNNYKVKDKDNIFLNKKYLSGNQVKTNQQFVNDIDNFPILVNVNKTQKQEPIEEDKKYLEMAKTEIVKEELIEDDIKPGHILITLEGNKITKRYSRTNPSENTYQDYIKTTSIIIDNMIYRWNKYRDEFIDLYGEDEYYNVYKPNDECSDEEDNNDNEEQDIMDDDYDYDDYDIY